MGEKLVPGRNGGMIKQGNVGNRGRAAAVVRAGVLKDAPAAHKFLVDLMKGKPVIPERSYCNTCDTETACKVSAPMAERLRAAVEVLRFGLGPAATTADVEDLQRRVRDTLGKQLAYLDARLRDAHPELYREVMLQLSELWAQLEQG